MSFFKKHYLKVVFCIILLALIFKTNAQASSDWQKYPSNPVFTALGGWDGNDAINPSVVKTTNTYIMYYTGNNGAGWRIGYAYSSDGINNWTASSNYVIPVGSSDGWEKETATPTVLIDKNGVYNMWYTSTDTSHWSYGLDRFRIRNAVSTDGGAAWTPDSGWELEGTAGKWDEGGLDRGRAIVIKDGTYYMIYAGTGSDLNFKLGLATSPDGVNWTKQNGGNALNIPLQAGELDTQSYPTVLYENGIFKMWYEAATSSGTQIDYAESPDGINWTLPADQNPVLTRGTSGFDSVALEPNVILHENDQYKLYYSGYDGNKWSIGLATLQADILPAKDLNVPLLRQTDPLWGAQVYDSASRWSPAHATISDWGCAETSAAMILQYYGITKLPNNINLDPGTLNTWLKNQPDGYIGNGLLNWLAISRLSKLAKTNNPNFIYDALEYRRKGIDKVSLTDDINAGQPDILEEPGHFIVGKGINADTFNINDPYYYNTRTELKNSAYNNRKNSHY